MAWRLLAVSAFGEMAVGLTVAAWPGQTMSLLLGMPVAGTGEIAARMCGIAVAALGATWWIDRRHLDGVRLRRLAPSFIGYNAGTGLLLLAHALSAERLLVVAWAVAATHLAAAGAYVAALAVRLRSGS